MLSQGYGNLFSALTTPVHCCPLHDERLSIGDMLLPSHIDMLSLKAGSTLVTQHRDMMSQQVVTAQDQHFYLQ